MPQANTSVATCQRKRHSATFRNKAVAKRVASEINRDGDHRVEWFRCTVCKKYHVGGTEPKLPMLIAFVAALRELVEGRDD